MVDNVEKNGKNNPLIEQVKKESSIPGKKLADVKTDGPMQNALSQDAATMPPATLNESLVKVLADQLNKNAENIDIEDLRKALKSLLKMGGLKHTSVFVYSWARLVSVDNFDSNDFKMFSKYLKENLKVTCPIALEVVEIYLHNIIDENIDIEDKYVLRVKNIIKGFGEIKDPVAVDAIVNIYKAVKDHNKLGTINKQKIKLACVEALANIDTEESLSALTQFGDESDKVVSSKIVDVVLRKFVHIWDIPFE